MRKALSLFFLILGLSVAVAADRLVITSSNGASAFELQISLDGQLWQTVSLDPRQSKVLELPELAVGSHTMFVRQTFSASITRLSGYDILVMPHYAFDDGRSVKYDLLNQNRLSTTYTFSVSARPTTTWGLLAKVDKVSGKGDPILDYFVGAYSTTPTIPRVAVFRSGVTLAADGTPSVRRSVPLADIDKMTAIRTPAIEGGEFNYFVGDLLNTSEKRTYFLGEVGNSAYPQTPFFNAGTFVAQRRRISGNQAIYDPIAGFPSGNFYAIPRAKGPQYTGTEVRDKVAARADTALVPRHVAWAVSWYESGNRGQQFMADAPGFAIITHDGGIGMFQITGSAAAGTAAGYPALRRISQLAASLDKNIEAGITRLVQGFNSTLAIGNKDRNVIEHWYNALWNYNGPNNNPNTYPDNYQTRILDRIETSPSGAFYSGIGAVGRPSPTDLGTTTTPRAVPYTPYPFNTQSPGVSTPAKVQASLDTTASKTTLTRGYDILITARNSGSRPIGNVLPEMVKLVLSNGARIDPRPATITKRTIAPGATASWRFVFETPTIPTGVEGIYRYSNSTSLFSANLP